MRSLLGSLALLLALALGHSIAARLDAPPVDDRGEMQRDACAAWFVAEVAPDASWLERAAIANATLRAGPGRCRGLAGAPWERDPREWQRARDVVDAVRSGDFEIAPPACAAATIFWPDGTTGAPGARVVCRIGRFNFAITPLDAAGRAPRSLPLTGV